MEERGDVPSRNQILAMGAGGYELARVIGQQLRQRSLKLAVAESCTGGLLAGQIVAVAGSSDYFLGGVVAYANQVKLELLGVAPATLAKHGAVSWQAAVEMAAGVRRVMGADVALSTTGIAGPTGGTPMKPVGLGYVALAAGGQAWWERHQWRGSRGENNAQTVLAALALLRRYLEDEATVLRTGQAGEAGYVSLAEAGTSSGTPIAVEFTTRQEGTRIPLAFHWQGQRYTVDNWGRSWEDVAGGKHYLVMSESQGTFELYHDPTQDRWYLLQAWPSPMVA